MQLQNIQQQTTKHVEVYYENLLKLTKYLHVKTTYVFFTTVFKASLLPYLKLTTTSMKRDTLIEHKEVVVCEENGLVSLSYNALLITPEANIVVKHVVPIVTTKSTLTYINCDTIGHLVETCHNMKRKVLGVPIAIVESTKPITKTKTQPINLGEYMFIILI